MSTHNIVFMKKYAKLSLNYHQISSNTHLFLLLNLFRASCYIEKHYEPRCEKTGLWGFRPGPTQTELYSHRRWLEA